jgi:hypothetical protein
VGEWVVGGGGELVYSTQLCGLCAVTIKKAQTQVGKIGWLNLTVEFRVWAKLYKNYN